MKNLPEHIQRTTAFHLNINKLEAHSVKHLCVTVPLVRLFAIVIKALYLWFKFEVFIILNYISQLFASPNQHKDDHLSCSFFSTTNKQRNVSPKSYSQPTKTAAEWRNFVQYVSWHVHWRPLCPRVWECDKNHFTFCKHSSLILVSMANKKPHRIPTHNPKGSPITNMLPSCADCTNQ